MVKIIQIDGHPFYASEFVKEGLAFETCIAAANDDKFFVALQRSLVGYCFASFPDHVVFYKWMVEEFKGRRCFAQVNRSVQCEDITSAFFADVEWNTWDRDPTAQDRLTTIKDAIRQFVPDCGDFVIEDLTRDDKEKGNVRNSFHLYLPGARYEDSNALKDLVVNRIWPSIQHLDNMRFEDKAILDLSVYTSNRFVRLH